VKQRLNDIRAASNDKRQPEVGATLAQIRKEVLDSETTDVGVVTSLMLGYRALEDWTGMIDPRRTSSPGTSTRWVTTARTLGADTLARKQRMLGEDHPRHPLLGAEPGGGAAELGEAPQ
jgi:hypothetical protein